MKDKKKEKEWLEEPTISFEVVDGELTIVGNPFDKEEEKEEQATSTKPQDCRN